MESRLKPAKLSQTLSKLGGYGYRYLLVDIRIPLSASKYRYLPSSAIYYDTYTVFHGQWTCKLQKSKI